MTVFTKITCTAFLLSIVSCSNWSTRDIEEENTLNGERYGRVVYNPAGLEELVASRREEAIARAKNFCGKSQNVHIVSEERKPMSELKKNYKNSVAFGVQSDVMVLNYKCH